MEGEEAIVSSFLFRETRSGQYHSGVEELLVMTVFE